MLLWIHRKPKTHGLLLFTQAKPKLTLQVIFGFAFLTILIVKGDGNENSTSSE